MVNPYVSKIRHYSRIYRKRGFRICRSWDRPPEPLDPCSWDTSFSYEQDWPTDQPCEICIWPGQSRVVVLQVRLQEGGMESLKAIEEQYGRLPNTPIAEVGREVRHFYFRAPSGFTPIHVQDLFRGMDILGKIVPAPPTIHPATGDEYRWDRDHDIAALEPAPFPSLLSKVLEIRTESVLRWRALKSLEERACRILEQSLLPVTSANHTGEMISLSVDDFLRFVSIVKELEEVRHG